MMMMMMNDEVVFSTCLGCLKDLHSYEVWSNSAWTTSAWTACHPILEGKSSNWLHKTFVPHKCTSVAYLVCFSLFTVSSHDLCFPICRRAREFTGNPDAVSTTDWFYNCPLELWIWNAEHSWSLKTSEVLSINPFTSVVYVKYPGTLVPCVTQKWMSIGNI